MGSEPRKTEFLRVLFHQMLDHPLRYSITPMLACSTDASKQPSGRKGCGGDPRVNGRFDPVGDRHSTDMPALAHQIDQSPVVLPLLDVANLELGHLRPTEATAEQNG